MNETRNGERYPNVGERYRIEGLLGEGAMARVYRAFDHQLQRLVVLKVLRSHEPDEIERFQREARAQASLEHEHICRVFDVGEIDGTAYIAMQLVDGRTLRSIAPRLELDAKIDLVEQVARAIQAAHEAGVVHRDINPGNVMVERRSNGRLHAYVVDFGIARPPGEAVDSDRPATAGAVAFMAPELLLGEAAGSDLRVDVYGLGATLYAVIAEQAPYFAETRDATARLVLTTEPVRLGMVAPGTPVDIETVTTTAMARDPARRYADARALADDLRRWRAGEPISAAPPNPASRIRPWWRVNRAAVVLATAALIALASSVAITIRLHSRDVERRALADQRWHQVDQMDRLLRRARMLPVHDTGGAERAVRRQLETIESSLMEHGPLAVGPAYTALGFGHLLLREFDTAESWLAAAVEHGSNSARVESALGIARAMRILASRRRPGESHRGPLPSVDETLRNLGRAGPDTADRDLFHRALGLAVADRLDEAIGAARESADRVPWLYEALQLEGDLLVERAERHRGRGDATAAIADLERAGDAYARGLAVARSDGWLYEAEAERLLAMAELLGPADDTTPVLLERARRAADRAALVRPDRPGPVVLGARVDMLLAERMMAGGGDGGPALSDAARAIDRARELGPENPTAAALRDRIDALTSESSRPDAR